MTDFAQIFPRGRQASPLDTGRAIPFLANLWRRTEQDVVDQLINNVRRLEQRI